MSRWLFGLLLATSLLFTGCASDGLVTTRDIEDNASNGVYQVSGAVIHPGAFQLPPGETVTLYQALKRAGGPKLGNSWDDGGDLSIIRVQRLVHGSIVEYSLNAHPGDRDENFIIKAGDVITVPKMPFTSPVPNPLPFAT